MVKVKWITNSKRKRSLVKATTTRYEPITYLFLRLSAHPSAITAIARNPPLSWSGSLLIRAGSTNTIWKVIRNKTFP
jgi:hypothetical protein